MLEKIKQKIEDMEYYELKELQKEVKNGSNNLSRIIGKKIKEFEQDTGSVCPVCNSVIDESLPTTFTLIFGPGSIRKKASFCAFDCLQYFISSLKEVKEVEQK